jgi:hypothetical protein
LLFSLFRGSNCRPFPQKADSLVTQSVFMCQGICAVFSGAYGDRPLLLARFYFKRPLWHYAKRPTCTTRHSFFMSSSGKGRHYERRFSQLDQCQSGKNHRACDFRPVMVASARPYAF